MDRACYHITSPLIYRNLSLQISTRQKLLEDCSQLAEHPFCRKFLWHARCLKIQGRMPLLRNETQRPQSPGEYEPNSDAYDAEFGSVFSNDAPDGSVDEVRQAWYPLTVLIRDFSQIRDLIWVCKNQLPPCLFQELTRHHPSCRMEIRSFRLLSLGESILDPHERELIQSPCLHSISAKATLRDSYGKANYNDDAIFEVVGVAPNLKHVNVMKPRLAAAPNAYKNLGKKIPPWKGFVPPFETRRKGALASLAYPAPSDISVKDIHQWSQHTDLSQLRFFMLGMISDPLVFDLLRKINLTSLTALDVNLTPKRETRDSLLHSAEQCIKQLAPLRGLRVEGHLIPTLFDSVLQQHGPTLHRLALICDYGLVEQLSTISTTEIRKIETRCTDLEYLGISVQLARIQASEKWDLCDICPNLPHLRELALDITDRESEALDPSSTESYCKIWTFINEKKKGCALTRLLIYDFLSDVRQKQDSLQNIPQDGKLTKAWNVHRPASLYGEVTCIPTRSM